MAKLIAAEKTTAGLRHAVVCPNVTRRTKERIAQSKRARAGPLAIFDQPQVARTCILGRFLFSRCFVFLWRYVCLFVFVEAAALRSIVLRSSICTRLVSHTQLPINNKCLCHLLFSMEMSLFSEYFVPLPFVSSLYREYAYAFSFRVVFFHLVTTGWIFYISQCKNSINQSISQSNAIKKRVIGIEGLK